MEVTNVYDIEKEMTFAYVLSDVGMVGKPRKCLLTNLCVNLKKIKTLYKT